MMTRKRPLLLTAFLVGFSTTATAFCPQPMSPTNSVTTSRNRPRIRVVATPFEEMEKEDEMEKEKDNDDDWTEVKGGFLPRIAGFRSKQQHALITEVATLQEYKAQVVDCDETIVVVKFYSPWCRTCKAMAPLFKKLANSLSDDDTIKFVQVAVTQDNALLHQGLGIPSVPFGHVYHKDAGLVEERKLKKQDFGKFKTVLQHYVDGSCDIIMEDDDDVAPPSAADIADTLAP